MLIVLPLIALWLLALLFKASEPSWRGAGLSAAVAWGTLLTAITESLSLVHGLTTGGVAGLWLAVDMALAIVWWRWAAGAGLTRVSIPQSPFLRVALGGIGLIAAVTGLIALLAPPNNWDSMTYHMSRVVHWMQNRSVAHYPTHDLRQLHLNPWAEFAVLHLQILSGSDRFANLVQWASLIGSLAGVSLIARRLGADARGQVLAAVVAVTIPMGILQATSTQTDFVVGWWLICFVYYGLVVMQDGPDGLLRGPWPLAAGSLGLAILTKATAYLYALPFVLWIIAANVRSRGRKIVPALLAGSAIVLAVNLGHFARNTALYGSPLGPGEETCPGCVYANDAVTPALVASNVLRNVGLHLGSPSAPLNAALEGGILRLHALLGVDIDDPRTTWEIQDFHVRPPEFHEDRDGNLLHFLLMVGATAIVVGSRRVRSAGPLLPYILALTGGFLLFCVYLKWQAPHSRLHLPLFLLWSPVIAVSLSRLPRKGLVHGLALLLIIAALPWVGLNTFRPLLGSRTIFNTDRLSLYFMRHPHLQPAFERADRFVRERHCGQIGLVIAFNSVEYPFWVLLHPAQHSVRIEHVEVRNRSAGLAQNAAFRDFSPCVTLMVYETVAGGQVTAVDHNVRPDKMAP